jgi:predicted DNA-binding transcriptional regulator YafY
LPAETIQYLEKIEQSLEVGSKPYKRYDQLRDVIDQISQARVDRRMVEIDYYTMSRKKRTRRKVAPYKIWLFDGAFYLVANCGLREDIRIFALDRIKSLRLTDEAFQIPEDFRIEDFMQTSFGVFHGKPQNVRIRFAPEVAGYIKEKTWHATQKLTFQSDGSVIFEARVAGTDEIKYWLMSWGARAEVLSPATLRDEMLSEAQNMLRCYQT